MQPPKKILIEDVIEHLRTSIPSGTEVWRYDPETFELWESHDCQIGMIKSLVQIKQRQTGLRVQPDEWMLKEFLRSTDVVTAEKQVCLFY
jgi:hypothetical protein